MVTNISCKFDKAGYNIFFVTALTVKSLWTLRQQRSKAKSIVDTIKCSKCNTFQGKDDLVHDFMNFNA